MSIGEDLAQARRRAGLTVTQVSQRTGIRKKITAPLSVRLQRVRWRLLRPGAHRVIARVAGADPGPLIAGYDAAHRAPQPITAADLLRPARPARTTRGTRWAGRGAGAGAGGPPLAWAPTT